MRWPLGLPRLTSSPLRTTKLSGALGSVSLAGTSAFQPFRSLPLNSAVTLRGVCALTVGSAAAR